MTTTGTRLPYISMNKLAEYMQANSTRRRQIVKSINEDNDFIKVYYKPFRSTMKAYFESGYNDDVIDAKIDEIREDLESIVDPTTWEVNDKKNSILALEAIKEIELPDLSNYELVTDIRKIVSIELAGVEVSIKPD